MIREICPAKGKPHSWRWDGDDPYLICVWCGKHIDAHTGRVIKEGQSTTKGADDVK